MGAVDASVCTLFNRLLRTRGVQRFFATVSRLGDGVVWYALMVVLPVIYGMQGLTAALHMGIVALIGLIIYKTLKRFIVRQRPFMTHPHIALGTAPLDRHSFPSGHTLHAVAFTLTAVAYYPGLLWVLGPFAAPIALSRMVLGLHYPSDVLAGAVIGAGLAWSGFVVRETLLHVF